MSENQTPPLVELAFEVTMAELEAFQALGPAGINVLRGEIREQALPAACRLQIASLEQQRQELEHALEGLEQQATLEPATNGGTPALEAASDPDAIADDYADQTGCEDAGQPPPATPPPSDPPAAAPDHSPPAPEPPATRRGGRRAPTVVDDGDIDRAARVCLEERKATATSIGKAALELAGGTATSPSTALLNRVREYLAANADRVMETGTIRGHPCYGYRPLGAPTGRTPAGDGQGSPWVQEERPGRSEPAGGAEDVLEEVKREIKRTLRNGPARIPMIAKQHDRPPAMVAQAMELLKRDDVVDKIPGGEYALIA